MSSELSLYDNAKQSVSLLLDIDEVKDTLDKATAVQEYMQRAGNDELAFKAAKYKMYCERQAGILLREMEKNKGELKQGDKFPQSSSTTAEDKPKTLAEIGISKDQSSKFQKLADIEEEKYDDVVETQIINGVFPNRAKTLSLANGDSSITKKFTGNNEWYTPEKYIESSRSVMGSIDLDPASNDHAQKIVNAEKYYTIDDDGLDQNWNGNIWLNPPYSAKEIKQFIDKLTSSEINQAIILTNNSTDTLWFKQLSEWCNLMCFTTGRVCFYSKDEQKSSPTNGQVFFYYGNNLNGFYNEFDQYGLIMEIVSG